MTEPALTQTQPMPSGETLAVPERIIVAPATGVFHRLEGDGHIVGGNPVGQGDVIGVVRSLGTSSPVQSPFQGLLVGMLVSDGQRVRRGQPIAWLRGA
jgi:biotin carboxyl carrier protein